jgi:hypothetical protein
MKSNFRGSLCICLFVIISGSFAQNVETMKTLIKLRSKTDSLERKISREDSLLKDQGDKLAQQEIKSQQLDSALVEVAGQLHRQFGMPALADEGFTIGVGATMILQGTNVPNAISSGNQRIGDASYSTDLTFVKKFATAGSRAFLHCEAGAGGGLDKHLRLFSYVNFDAIGSQGVQVSEAWYEQPFIEDKLTGTIGLMDPSLYFDGNVSANDETVQFISQLLVINPTIEYPSMAFARLYAPGILVHADPLQWLHVTTAIFDANQDWDRIGENIFGMGEISLSSKIFGLSGHYRFYGWLNQMPHASWKFPKDTINYSYGFGISLDQQLDEFITPFFRFGWREPSSHLPDTVNAPIAMSWSAGVQIDGKPWKRENDALGIGVGQVVPSQDYVSVNPRLNVNREMHIEAYYRIQCFDKMSISPDFQYVLNPFGERGAKTLNIPVFGVRSQVDF